MTQSLLLYLDPVPFTIDNEASFGMTETQGLLSCDGTNLVIEYRTADTVVGIVKTDSKEITIPLDTIRSIRFTTKYLGMSSAIALTTLNQRVLEALADSRQGLVEMKIKRRDRDVAENFCLEIAQAVMRSGNERIAGDIE